MYKTLLVTLVVCSLLTGCANPASNNQAPPPIEESTSTQSNPATNTPLPPTASPSPTPTSTATPAPKYFNAQNFNQFTGVESYGSALAKYFKKDSYDVLTYAMDYSADGKSIAIGGCITSCSTTLGGRVFLLLLDAALVQPILEIPLVTKNQIWDVDLNPDGSLLFFSIRGQVFRYDRSTGQISTFYTPTNGDQVPFEAISPDGKTLVIVTDNELLALNLADGSQIAQVSGTYYGFNSPFYNAKGNRFIVYTQQTDRDVIVYDTDTWTEITRFPIAGAGKASISTDGNLVATLSENDPTVKLYDLASGSKKDISIAPYIEVTSLIFNPANDLLLTFGSPGEEVDFYEGVQIIDLQSLKVVGSLTQDSNPGKIEFSADGTTFLRLGYEATSIEQWSLPNADTLEIEALVDDYFSAISKGDFESAAAMTQLDSYAHDEVISYGLNPDDLPAVFQSLCAVDEVPCLPLGRIVRVMADFDRGWDYYALVTLQQPDGSDLMFDDITPYEMLGIIRLDDGTFKISTLHPGMRYPYKE